MKYRKLRIAWSVACGALAVLLIALWVRSYTRYDEIYIRLIGNTRVGMASYYGCFSFGYERKAPHSSQLNTSIEIDSGYYKSDPWLDQQIQAAIPASGFNMTSFPGGGRLDVPSYFAVLIAFIVTIFAARPWIRQRFSLRTLLIGMTVAAAILGAVVYVATN